MSELRSVDRGTKEYVKLWPHLYPVVYPTLLGADLDCKKVCVLCVRHPCILYCTIKTFVISEFQYAPLYLICILYLVAEHE